MNKTDNQVISFIRFKERNISHTCDRKKILKFSERKR